MLCNDLVAIGFSSSSDWLRIAGLVLSGEISGHTGQKGRLQQSLITFNLTLPT